MHEQAELVVQTEARIDVRIGAIRAGQDRDSGSIDPTNQAGVNWIECADAGRNLSRHRMPVLTKRVRYIHVKRVVRRRAAWE